MGECGTRRDRELLLASFALEDRARHCLGSVPAGLISIDGTAGTMRAERLSAGSSEPHLFEALECLFLAQRRDFAVVERVCRARAQEALGPLSPLRSARFWVQTERARTSHNLVSAKIAEAWWISSWCGVGPCM